jgi:hypothetical protein
MLESGYPKTPNKLQCPQFWSFSRIAGEMEQQLVMSRPIRFLRNLDMLAFVWIYEAMATRKG